MGGIIPRFEMPANRTKTSLVQHDRHREYPQRSAVYKCLKLCTYIIMYAEPPVAVIGRLVSRAYWSTRYATVVFP